MGLIVTSTTELATDVYSKEAIQAMKCRPRKLPATAACSQSRPLNAWRCCLRKVRARGVSTSAASPSRYAAMMSTGALVSLMRIEALLIIATEAVSARTTRMYGMETRKLLWYSTVAE